jgi:hypothetical protein
VIVLQQAIRLLISTACSSTLENSQLVCRPQCHIVRHASCQIGQRVAVTRVNPATRKSEIVWETHWQVVHVPYEVRLAGR